MTDDMARAFRTKKTVAGSIVLAGVMLFTGPGHCEDKVCFESTCFQVKLADTFETRTRGLQFRFELPSDQGMLFIFPEKGRYAFWMKSTLIPLDIIWLDDEFRVVHIEHELPPCRREPCPTFRPPVSARYVLEINAGLAGKYGIKRESAAVFHHGETIFPKPATGPVRQTP